ncbi:hypothetical protein [Methylobacterium sp. B4]|nr:hypothetical protein [Methylobacterium sp. B4]
MTERLRQAVLGRADHVLYDTRAEGKRERAPTAARPRRVVIIGG